MLCNNLQYTLQKLYIKLVKFAFPLSVVFLLSILLNMIKWLLLPVKETVTFTINDTSQLRYNYFRLNSSLKQIFGQEGIRYQKSVIDFWVLNPTILVPRAVYLLRRPFKNWWETKTCGLIFQDGGSHKPNYIYISFYKINIIIKVFNYFWYRPLFVSSIYN
jgi:hypothetical protein